MMGFGYEGTTAENCMFLLVVLIIFKSQNYRFLQTYKQ